MVGDANSLIARGRTALVEGNWQEARDLFESSLAGEDTAEAQAGLSEALWWLGELTASMDHREQAYALFRRRPEPAEAFNCALFLVLDYQSHVGNYAAASGWLARAERLIHDFDLDEFRGWLLLAKSNGDCDPSDGEELARQALEIAKTTDDLDLELCALSQIGAHLVQQGRTRQGIAYLDEAMAGSLGGEGGNLDTVVLASCNMMVSCISAADFDHAVQWVHAADRFAARYGCPFLYVECRTIYGRVLFSTGHWEAAEEELRTAIASAKGSAPVYNAQALATFAELRLAQGQQAEARRLLSGIEDHVWAVPVVARLHLLAGRAAAAKGLLERHLPSAGTDRLQKGVLMELIGEAEIAEGGLRAAEIAGQELLALGEGLDSEVLAVRGRRLLGRSYLAQGDLSLAREHLESALSGFLELQMVYEAASTRLLLGELIADVDTYVAAAETKKSLEVFEELGARPDADRAAQLLRRLGFPPGVTGARNQGSLTSRENQVLELLGEGLTNPEIAERLYISRKTVEHHVARVLSKLQLRNRAEAAAEAVRRSGAKSAGR